VPSRLERYQRFGSDHFITFSCYRRLALLNSDYASRTFEHVLEHVRRWYGLYVFGYVIMPDHVHLLVSEPHQDELKTAIQMLKQLVARRLHGEKAERPFWQARYYDFNVITRKKWVEKLRYIHRNPVTRGLASAPEEWKWSSYRHWLTGEKGTVEIESHWTFNEREKMGVNPTFMRRTNDDGPSDPTLTPKEG
jgi:putative transposase